MKKKNGVYTLQQKKFRATAAICCHNMIALSKAVTPPARNDIATVLLEICMPTELQQKNIYHEPSKAAEACFVVEDILI